MMINILAPHMGPKLLMQRRGARIVSATHHFKNFGLLNQYQGGMCILGRFTMTSSTPRHLISPLGPNWVGTDSAV